VRTTALNRIVSASDLGQQYLLALGCHLFHAAISYVTFLGYFDKLAHFPSFFGTPWTVSGLGINPLGTITSPDLSLL
jgi:hypothetical protein